MKSQAHVVGDIHHQSLAIESGAFFDGRSVQIRGNGQTPEKLEGKSLRQIPNTRDTLSRRILSLWKPIRGSGMSESPTYTVAKDLNEKEALREIIGALRADNGRLLRQLITAFISDGHRSPRG